MPPPRVDLLELWQFFLLTKRWKLNFVTTMKFAKILFFPKEATFLFSLRRRSSCSWCRKAMVLLLSKETKFLFRVGRQSYCSTHEGNVEAMLLLSPKETKFVFSLGRRSYALWRKILVLPKLFFAQRRRVHVLLREAKIWFSIEGKVISRFR